MTDTTTEMLALADRLGAECKTREADETGSKYCPELTSMFRECEAALRASAGAHVAGQRSMQERAKAVENVLRSFNLECGEEVNLADCIAHFREENNLVRANELIEELALDCAEAAVASIPLPAALKPGPSDTPTSGDAVRALNEIRGTLDDATRWLEWCVDEHDAPDNSAETAALKRVRRCIKSLPKFIAALSKPEAAPAGEVVVKPLEWVDEPMRTAETPAWNATDPVGNTYRVFSAWWGAKNKTGFVYREFHHTADAAKAAAQADYEQRIRSALIATPPAITEREKVMREALVTILANTEEDAIPHIAHSGMTAYQALAKDIADCARAALVTGGSLDG